MHRVEQPVLRKFRMKVEADESALQPVVHREWENGADVRIERGLVVAIEQVEHAARVVGEPPAVRKVADEADARPAGRHDVLIGGRIPRVFGRRTTSRISTVSPRFVIGDRNRITGDRLADLRVRRAGGTEHH